MLKYVYIIHIEAYMCKEKYITHFKSSCLQMQLFLPAMIGVLETVTNLCNTQRVSNKNYYLHIAGETPR